MDRDNFESSEEIPLRERPIAEVSGALQLTLGQRLVAYAIRERDPRRIGRLAREEDIPTNDEEATLRDLAEVTEVLSDKGCTDNTLRALMIGSNPRFNGAAPIELFHHGESARVLSASSGFLEGYS